jgi:ATPase subunit of ABC transporter with duplicated ATPase domains
MISFSNINKQYGKQLLFVDASFQLNPGEKVGLGGPNGAGKTALFRMVVGEETPDEGAVSVPKKLTIGYFRQDVEEMQGRSVLDEAIAGSGRVGDLHHELEALQREMSDPDKADDMDRILDRFGHVQEEYEHLGGYALESQAREVLHGLGFKDNQIDGDVGALSGGWKMRVALARVLLGMPDVFLMEGDHLMPFPVENETAPQPPNQADCLFLWITMNGGKRYCLNPKTRSEKRRRVSGLALVNPDFLPAL